MHMHGLQASLYTYTHTHTHTYINKQNSEKVQLEFQIKI